MAAVSLNCIGHQLVELREDQAILVGILRQVMGWLDGMDARPGSIDEQLRGLRGEPGGVHRPEDRSRKTSTEIAERRQTLEARIEWLEHCSD